MLKVAAELGIKPTQIDLKDGALTILCRLLKEREQKERKISLPWN